MNPLLAHVDRAIAHACERWADEDAASAVGDRSIAARAVAVAALQGSGDAALSAAAVPASGGRVTQRVSALLAPPRRRRLAPAVSLVAMIGVMAAASVVQCNNTDAALDSARTAVVQGGDVAAG
jgi:hypothetical protein